MPTDNIPAPEAPADPLADILAELRDIRQALTVRRLDDRLALDATELAAALGVSERMVWTMNSSAEIPAPARFHTRTCWIVQEIRDWLAAGKPHREQWEKQKPRRK